MKVVHFLKFEFFENERGKKFDIKLRFRNPYSVLSFGDGVLIRPLVLWRGWTRMR